jgi:hypothetical protein
MNPIFLGQVKNGILILNAPERYAAYLPTLNGKEVQLSVGSVKKQRTKRENRYYWGVVIRLLSEVTGYNDDEMHDALRMLFLKDTDRTIPVIRSTASLTTLEFENYLEKIRLWAGEKLNCYIPLPNEVEV